MPSTVALPSPRQRPSLIRAAALCSYLWAISSGGNPAEAAPADRCQADPICQKQVADATQLAAKARYDEALDLYQQAYDKSHEPRLLINIGRCQYRLGQPQKALDSYEAFRRDQSNIAPDLLSRLNQFVAEAKLALLTAEREQEKEKERAAAEAAANEIEPPPAPLRSPWDGKMLLGRPAWRVGLGIGAVAIGGPLFGLGIGALAANGGCATPSTTVPGQCATELTASGMRATEVLNGITPGVPMLISGVLLLTGGVLLLALPNRTKKYAQLPPVGLLFSFGSTWVAP